MDALPPNKEMCDKYYLGFYDGEKLIAVMDFIMAYPDELTAFIGFFMTDVSIQNTGTGSKIMGNSKLSAMSTVLEIKSTSLTKYLRTLMDLDILEREVPVTEDNPEKSKKGLYRIKDNYLRFWHALLRNAAPPSGTRTAI